jgi:aryl-alcohol dehydrogenase-like predicted oxidoreductase
MMTLPSRQFGKTGERWPALAMGGGFPGFAGFDRSIQTVRHAFDLGIRYFDTSVMYRFGASQAIMGDALVNQTEPHFVATKVGYFKDARHFRSVEALDVQLRENLRLLRRDSVDLLQIHEADWDNWWTDRTEVTNCRLFDEEGSFDFENAPVIQFLREAKARGLCRHIGVAGNNARHMGRVIREVNGLDSVLVAYNYTPLNVTTRDHIFAAAQARGMAIIVAGIFTFVYSLPAKWRTEATYLGGRADQQLAELQALQSACGIPMAELAVRFVTSDERLSTTLVGACHPAEIEQNVASFLKGKLPDDVHAAMEAIAAKFEPVRAPV